MSKSLYSLGMPKFGTSSGKKGTYLNAGDKETLYKRAKCRCENCEKKISFFAMQAGHKNKPASKGGKATLGNSVCLCYECNKQQRTRSWAAFRKSQGRAVKATATSSKRKRKSRKRGSVEMLNF
jgi:hypothetical protein